MANIITKSVLTAALALGMASQVSAHLVTPDGNLVVGSNDGQAGMDTLLGVDVGELWKWEGTAVGGTAYSGNGFTVTFSQDLLTATLSWDLTGTGIQLYGIAWKDGRLDPELYPNDQLGFYWSGVTESQRLVSDGDMINMPIDLAAFKNPTAWSHIAFYGTGGGTSVPDGGVTLALLGVAITGLGLLRRKMK